MWSSPWIPNPSPASPCKESLHLCGVFSGCLRFITSQSAISHSHPQLDDSTLPPAFHCSMPRVKLILSMPCLDLSQFPVHSQSSFTCPVKNLFLIYLIHRDSILSYEPFSSYRFCDSVVIEFFVVVELRAHSDRLSLEHSAKITCNLLSVICCCFFLSSYLFQNMM